jgi:hypothetical protein
MHRNNKKVFLEKNVSLPRKNPHHYEKVLAYLHLIAHTHRLFLTKKDDYSGPGDQRGDREEGAIL